MTDVFLSIMKAFCAVVALTALLAGSGAPARAADPFLRRTATVEVVQQAGPAVVNITTERIVQRRGLFGPSPFGNDPFFNDFFERFFEPRTRSESVQNLGSGVLIDSDRHVLTNAHVVERADKIQVKLADGREFEAVAVGADPNNDLAVLRVETDENLPWVAPGRSDDLLVGEPVIAIGNPFGLSNTVTTGVISALDRSIRSEQRVFHGFLQTDASINPGNSGGPLLNAEGTLIGINTAIYNGAEGIGFAIPIDVAKRIVQELIVHGEVAPVWLGLELQDLNEGLADALELPGGFEGVLVNRVHKDSPAKRAGAKRGDVVRKLDGQNIRSARGFYEVLNRVTGDQRVELGVWREGQEQNLTATAARLPAGLVDELAERMLGMGLELREGGGFVVKSVREGSSAEEIGIRAGDLVLGINGQTLRDADALQKTILQLRGRDRALVVVQRGNGRYHVTLPLV